MRAKKSDLAVEVKIAEASYGYNITYAFRFTYLI